MQQPLTWPDLAELRVGVYGLGVEGRANVRACRALGVAPVLVDDRAQDDPEVLVTARGGLDALSACDVVVVSPGISIYSAAVEALRARGVRVAGGLGLWLAGADRSRVIAVTGTKGKSTTAAFTGHLLTAWGHRCGVGGNIGAAPWDPEIGDDYDFWVVEVSSYQATGAEVAPPVVVVTSLNPDHLPWHRGDVETYYRDKLSLCTRPGARVTVANGDSPELTQRAALLGPTVRWVTDADAAREPWTDAVPLLGRHNRRNAVLAATALREAGFPEASDAEALREAGASFEPLEHRLTLVATVDGVRFVDDGLATNVLPTIAALESFPGERIALIVGGQDRGIDYRPLGAHLRESGARVLVLAIPQVGARIAAEVGESLAGTRAATRECSDLAQAVAAGFEWARPGGIVLLSPAAPSFGDFKDYKERSDAFAAAAGGLRGPARR